jgi:hypothetical protein
VATSDASTQTKGSFSDGIVSGAAGCGLAAEAAAAGAYNLLTIVHAFTPHLSCFKASSLPLKRPR